MNKSNKNKRASGSVKKPISAENKMMVLLEAVHDDVKIIAEGHSVLNKKIDDNHKALNEKIDTFKFEMTEFKQDMTEFKQEMTEFKQDMLEFKNDTKSSFQTIFNHLSGIDDELKSIKSELAELKAILDKKADKERLLDLERRVILLEKELAASR